MSLIESMLPTGHRQSPPDPAILEQQIAGQDRNRIPDFTTAILKQSRRSQGQAHYVLSGRVSFYQSCDGNVRNTRTFISFIATAQLTCTKQHTPESTLNPAIYRRFLEGRYIPAYSLDDVVTAFPNSGVEYRHG